VVTLVVSPFLGDWESSLFWNELQFSLMTLLNLSQLEMVIVFLWLLFSLEILG
jgi:hypothetical protein